MFDNQMIIARKTERVNGNHANNKANDNENK